jgi:hypothetical protein
MHATGEEIGAAVNEQGIVGPDGDPLAIGDASASVTR